VQRDEQGSQEIGRLSLSRTSKKPTSNGDALQPEGGVSPSRPSCGHGVAAQRRLLRIPNCRPPTPGRRGRDGQRRPEGGGIRPEAFAPAPSSALGHRFPLGLWDPEAASKLSGAMFSLLRGQGASPAVPGPARSRPQPDRTRNPSAALRADGDHVGPATPNSRKRLSPPGRRSVASPREKCRSWVSTAGDPRESELPKRYMATRSAGGGGWCGRKGTRGMQRCTSSTRSAPEAHAAEQVQEEFDALLADAERPLRLLGLPTRRRPVYGRPHVLVVSHLDLECTHRASTVAGVSPSASSRTSRLAGQHPLPAQRRRTWGSCTPERLALATRGSGGRLSTAAADGCVRIRMCSPSTWAPTSSADGASTPVGERYPLPDAVASYDAEQFDRARKESAVGLLGGPVALVLEGRYTSQALH